MAKPLKPVESPNPEIDEALKQLLKKLKQTGEGSVHVDSAVKIVNAAVAWEKVKHQIKDDGTGYDPDDL